MRRCKIICISVVVSFYQIMRSTVQGIDSLGVPYYRTNSDYVQTQNILHGMTSHGNEIC